MVDETDTKFRSVMIILLTGLPGSGKSLKASQMIYDLAFNENSKDYKKRKRVYTNLDQFDFDKCNKVTDIEFIPLNMDLLSESLNDLYVLREESDEILKKYCDEKHLSDAYYIIDEAHNDFMKQDKVLIWWLSYHRHLHQDIVLITQNKTLINSYYRHFPEFFYHAQPASKRIFNRSARYKVYSSFGHFKKDLIRTETVKIDKRYFSLYHSGDHSKPMNIVRRFAFIAVALAVLTVIGFKVALMRVSGDFDERAEYKVDHVENVATRATSTTNAVVPVQKDPEGRDILVSILCDGIDCWDSYQNSYSLRQISDFISIENNQLLSQNTVYSSTTKTIRCLSIRTNKSMIRKHLFLYFNSDQSMQEGFLGDSDKPLGV